mgnify:FL=1
MVLSLMVAGSMTFLTGMAEKYLVMAKSMRANGCKVDVREREYILVRMGHHILGSGLIISSTAMVIKNG